jgi:Uri superfamily endonuclease
VKGIYALLLFLDTDLSIYVGALGKISFTRGAYVYVGSAQNNLEKRVARHMRKEKKLFWHIDYFLDSGAARILKVFYKRGGKAEECVLANEIAKRGDPIKGFGCSDCSCTSHLFHLNSKNLFNLDFVKELKVDDLKAD